jgi:hypothetical protein
MPSPNVRQSKLTPRYGYNSDAGRYIDNRSGRFVPQSRIKGLITRQITRSRNELVSLATQLQNGEINLQEWRLASIQELKVLHVANAAAAKGGWAQMTQADYGRAGGKLRSQIEYFDHMAAQVQYGTQKMDGRFMQRVQMYANAGYGTYSQTERESMVDQGMTEERRVRNAAESCDDCIEYANLGWQPIGTLPRIGDSQCLTHCACEFEYR